MLLMNTAWSKWEQECPSVNARSTSARGNKRNKQLTTNGLSKIYRMFTFGSLRVCSARADISRAARLHYKSFVLICTLCDDMRASLEKKLVFSLSRSPRLVIIKYGNILVKLINFSNLLETFQYFLA